jgi:hypothetical protein
MNEPMNSQVTTTSQPPLAPATGSVHPCDWHKDETPIEDDDTPGCCGCGRMYHTRVCEGCGSEFMEWEAKGGDDVCAGPYVTTSGDLYCTYCGPGHDRAQEEAEGDNDFGDWPP